MFVEVSSSHLALSRLDENWMRNQRLKPSRRSLPVGQLGPWQWLRGLRFEIIESHRIIESSPCHHMSSYDISMYPFTVLTRWTHRLRRWTACCGQGQCQPETELCEIQLLPLGPLRDGKSHLYSGKTWEIPGEAACLGCPHRAAHSAGDAGDISGDICDAFSPRHRRLFLSYVFSVNKRSVENSKFFDFAIAIGCSAVPNVCGKRATRPLSFCCNRIQI